MSSVTGSRLSSRVAALIFTAALLVLSSAPSAYSETGDLAHPPAPSDAGCIDNDGTQDCAAVDPNLNALRQVNAIAVSPDGNNIYATTLESDSLLSFSRDSSTGKLTQLPNGCIGDDIADPTTGPGCSLLERFNDPTDVVVSPDGENVYVATNGGSAVWAFNRNSSGELSVISSSSCVAGTLPTTPCSQRSDEVNDIRAIAISADGKNIYTAGDNGVGMITRNTSDGSLTTAQTPVGVCAIRGGATASCLDINSIFEASDVVVVPEDNQIVVTSTGSDAVTVLNRNTTTGLLSVPSYTPFCVTHDSDGPSTGSGRTDFSCSSSQAPSLRDPSSVAISPDGSQLAVTSPFNDAVSILDRITDQSSGSYGQISQRTAANGACISDGAVTDCTNWSAPMTDPSRISYSNDGNTVYWTNRGSHSVAVAKRDTSTGVVTADSCHDDSGGTHSSSCHTTRVMHTASALVVTPDDGFVYVGSSSDGATDVDADATIGDPPRVDGSIVTFERERAPEPPPTTTTTTPITERSTTEVTPPPTEVCTNFIRGKQYTSVSRWGIVPNTNGQRIRLITTSGSYVSSVDKKKARFRLRVRRVLEGVKKDRSGKKAGKITRVDYYLDGKFMKSFTAKRQSRVFEIEPSTISEGLHTVTAKVYSSKNKKPVERSLKFVNGRCEPSFLTLSSLSRGAYTHTKLYWTVRTGDTAVSSAKFSLPTKVNLRVSKLKRQKGKTIGRVKVHTIDGSQYSSTLKLPKSYKGKRGEIVKLRTGNGKVPTVTMEAKNRGWITVTELPANVNSIVVQLDGVKNKILRNDKTCGKMKTEARLAGVADTATLTNSRLSVCGRSGKAYTK